MKAVKVTQCVTVCVSLKCVIGCLHSTGMCTICNRYGVSTESTCRYVSVLGITFLVLQSEAIISPEIGALIYSISIKPPAPPPKSKSCVGIQINLIGWREGEKSHLSGISFSVYIEIKKN